ncbi:aquaporin [Leuconostocaceae bacterium ESL0723]|nr:aquaporin [Leuconostocaceae bacterium ESL0723]
MRKYLGEFIGTLLFIFFVSTSLVYMTAFQLSQVFDIMLIFGLAVGVTTYLFGSWSNGGYYNPAVTLGAMVQRKISWQTGLGYMLAQLVGALVGMALTIASINGIVNGQKVTQGQTLGTTEILSALRPTSTTSVGPYTFAVELLLTFLVVYVTLKVLSEKKATAPVLVGIVLTLAMFVAYPMTGGALNPVRVLAPLFFGGNPSWILALVYLVAEFLAGALAGLVATYDHSQNKL